MRFAVRPFCLSVCLSNTKSVLSVLFLSVGVFDLKLRLF